MQVRLYSPDQDAARWDRYVRQHPDATFFHLCGWEQLLREIFGHSTCYLMAEDRDRLVGVMPLAQVRSSLFGNSLVSLPLCVYGGAIADSSEAERALVEAAIEVAGQRRVDHLELRHRQPMDDLATVERYVRFRRSISDDDDANLRAIPRKQRAMVRKGMRNGLTSVIGPQTAEFYRLYAESLRNLGTPVLPRAYFDGLQRIFGDACEQLTVVHEGQAIASVLSFYFREEVLPYYGGGSVAARRLAGNDFMYWELMRHAASRGIRQFDFGRSRIGAGSFDFKRHWGFEPEALHYQYYLVKAAQPPDPSPDNPRFRFLISCWQRLPLPVTMWLGPMVSRHLAW